MTYQRPHLRLQPLKRAMANEDRLTPAQFRDRMARGIPAHIKPGPKPVIIYSQPDGTATAALGSMRIFQFA